jgi:outer membrane protein
MSVDSNRALAVIFYWALVGLCSPSDVYGQSAPEGPCRFDGIKDGELSLARAVDLALCSNADIQSAAATVRVRAAQLGEARAEYWPTLTGSATQLRETTQFPGTSQPPSTDSAVTMYGALSWRVLDFGGRNADSRAARELLQVALGTRDATAQKVLGTVVEAYFDAITAKALLGSKAEDETLARDTVASAERRLRRGDGAQSDILQAKTALARAALDSHRASGSYEKSLAVLAYSVGLPTGIVYAVPDDIVASTAEVEKSLVAWLNDARHSHPAIVAARADVEAAQAQVVSARSAGRPTVDFQANYYANGFPQQGLATTRQRNSTVGIAITVPLFDGFLNRYKVREAQASVSLKEATLIDAERVTLTEIVKSYYDATAAVENLEVSKDLFDSASASVASSRRRYESGAADILELLTSQSAFADARQERVRSLADWRSARLRLLATSGVLTNASF